MPQPAEQPALFACHVLFLHLPNPQLFEAVKVLVALGMWDLSLAQAMAAEIAERRMSHDQEAEQHCMNPSAQQHSQGITRAALAQLLAIEKEALATLLLQPGGAEELRSYLASPGICGACLNLREPLVACRQDCGRQLCPECLSVDNIGSNLRICAHPHPTAWRAAIKLLPGDCEIVARWQTAAKHADLRVGSGRRRADQGTEPSI